ncbi:NAD(P)-dependent oxidoreductase [Ramlibacter sp. PS4R-6]|uniref:NAD(P)-dependent oxidoreductase n=1 Tax=Ramlibacter sp. PS4R-6 TaxID=3133438 RepID=UPI00309ECCBC
MRTVGIVGVGNMGGGMAAHLLAQGWTVHVHDIVREKVDAFAALGAVPCANAAEAAQDVAALVVCVVDAAQAREVLFGPGGGAASLRKGAAVLLCPTISPRDVESIASQLREIGIAAIDAPMSGGPARARDGSMSLMVACNEAVFEANRPLVEALSRKVFRVGDKVGDGARTKLVNNLLAAINLVGAAEAIALARKLGLDARTTLDVIEQSSGQSWIGVDRMRRAIEGDFEPRAHMTLLAKDSRLALEEAQAAGFEGPLGAAARDVFARAVEEGLAGLDDAALLTLLSS